MTRGIAAISELDREKWCPSCRTRFRLGPPTAREYQFIEVPSRTVQMLLAAAVEFDETAERLTPGECFSAVDFLDWIRPSLKKAGSPVSLRTERR